MRRILSEDSKSIPGCQYKRGGWRLKHGDGARKCWKQTIKDVMGSDGKVNRKYSRTVYYVCDISRSGSRLKQTKLQFFKGNNESGGGDDTSKEFHLQREQKV